jgi:preprotein translocase subunit SecA
VSSGSATTAAGARVSAAGATTTSTSAGPAISGGLAPDPMAQARAISGRDGGNGSTPGQAKLGFTPTGARIGRNDACWCGSGLKYKKCHGRS